MKSRTCATPALILTMASVCLAQPGGRPEQAIAQLKKSCRETVLATEGKSRATIIVPEGDNYLAMAIRVQKAIADAAGATVPIKLHSQATDEDLRQHAILLGNMDNNSLAEKLYWQRYLACDLDYPGPDGYVVRTACDPWGNGKNAILLGGSDAGGVRRAVEVFLPRVKSGRNLVLPLLLDIKLPGLETVTDEVLQKEWDYYRKRYLEAKGLWYGCEGPIHRLAYDYCLTGVEEYAKIYNEVIKRWMQEYYRWTPGRQLVTPKYAMPDMYLAWNLVEESPSVTDEVRLEMTNLLYDYAIRMGEGPRVRDWQPGRMRLTGHVPLLSVLYGHDYFTKHYPNAPMMKRLEEGMKNVRIAMASYFQTDGFMSETGYLGIHPRLLTYYTQYTGDYRWFGSRNALRWEEYHTLVTDNAGSAVGGYSPSHLLAARYYRDGRWLWLSNFQRRSSDYGTRIVNGKLKRQAWLGRPDIEPAPPMHMTGMRAFRMGEAWYKELSLVRGQFKVPQEKTFNQVAMRTDFDKSSQYARIAGVNIGFHYGTPANAFMRLCDKGRNWVVNGRWGMSLMKYYNTVLVVRNGQASPRVPYLCSLETACDLPRTGFLQSQMPKHNATDWMRSVVWNKQRYWLVFDAVRPREAGHYTCLCQWRVGPRPKIEGGKAVVGGDPALVIETVGAPALTVTPETSAHGTVSSHLYRQSRSGVMQPGREATFCNLLWVRGGTASLEGWARWQADASTANFDSTDAHSGLAALRLVCTGEKWHCVRQRLPALEPGRKYRVHGWARTNGKVGATIELRVPATQKAAIARASTAAKEWTRLQFEFGGPSQGHAAELWLLHTTYKADGGIAWFDDIEVTKIDEPKKALLLNGDFAAVGDVSRMRAQYSVRGLADGCAIVSDGSAYWLAGVASDARMRSFAPAKGLSVRAKAFNISPAEFALTGATALSWGEKLFAGDKPVNIAIDMATGEGVVEADQTTVIKLYSADGRLVLDGKDAQAIQAGAMVELMVPAGRHELRIGVPSAAQRMADARQMWQDAEPPGEIGAEKLAGRELRPVWEWQDKEQNAPANAVRTADLDGDGTLETVVGLADGATVVLSAAGKEVCRHKSGKAVNDLACLDLDGDGKLEVLSASDDFTVYATDRHGQELWAFNNEGLEITNKLAGEQGTGRYTSSEGEFVSLKVADLDGDGTPEILAGAKTFMHGGRRVFGTLWALSPQGKQLWHVCNFAGTVDTIDCADVDGDGKLEVVMGTGGGTYGRRAYIVDSQGQPVADYGGPYGEKRAAFARLRSEGPLAVVRLEHTDGTLQAYSADKEHELWWTFPTSGLTTAGPIITDFDRDGINEVLIGGASGDVYLLADAVEGRLVWRTNLGAPVTCLRAAKLDGQDRIFVGTRGGTLFVLGNQGQLLAHARLASDIIDIGATPEARRVVAGLLDGRIVGLAL